MFSCERASSLARWLSNNIINSSAAAVAVSLSLFLSLRRRLYTRAHIYMMHARCAAYTHTGALTLPLLNCLPCSSLLSASLSLSFSLLVFSHGSTSDTLTRRAPLTVRQHLCGTLMRLSVWLSLSLFKKILPPLFLTYIYTGTHRYTQTL